jgi:HSP20 family molecular chaperone IbpA
MRNSLIPRSSAIGHFMDDMESQFSKVLDTFFAPTNIATLKNRVKNNSGYPKLDTYTTENSFCVQASVPGVRLEDLDVSIQEQDGARYVTIGGSMSEEYKRSDETTNWQVKEMCRRAFARTLLIPTELQGDPDAKLKDGILTLTWQLPKVEVKEPKKLIAVKSE